MLISFAMHSVQFCISKQKQKWGPEWGNFTGQNALKNHCAESAYYNVLPFKQGVNAKKENE